MRLLGLTFSILLLTVSPPLMAQSPWELKVDEDSIQVFTRSLPGKKYLEIKASTTMNTSINSLMALMKSVDLMGEWMKNFEVNELLSSESFWEQISYHEVYVPLIQNRDVVLQTKVKKSANGAISISMLSLPDYIPEKRKRTRIQEMNGEWICKPINEGQIQVEYTMYVNPGRTIPAWLYNMRVKKDPYNTLRNIKEMVKKPEFSNAYFSELRNDSN